MNVINLADGLRKKPKIVPLRESGQLRNIVQPHIHQSRNASPFQRTKERLSRLLRKTYRKNLQVLVPLNVYAAGKATSISYAIRFSCIR